MAERLKRSPSTISYELSRCQPYQAELAQANAEYKRARLIFKLRNRTNKMILNHLMI